MPQLNTETLLAEVAPDAPCGADLSYDGAFMELERVAQGGPQDRIVGPDVVSDGPDWRSVQQQATGLFGRTKDLRVAVLLTKALLRTSGFTGFYDGTLILRELLTRYWDTVHPQLLAEDDFSPIMRVNALRDLCDRVSVLNPLRTLPLVSVAQLGKFSLRDIAVATGEIPPTNGVPIPDLTAITAAFEHCPIEALATTANAVNGALENIQAIDQWMVDKVGASESVNLDDLTSLLRQADQIVRERLSGRSPSAADTDGGNGMGSESAADFEPELSSTVVSGGGPSAGAAGGKKAAKVGEISSRNDVIRALDAVCSYYERNEPSSPVPILLRRAQRLVTMNFVDIMRDLAPSAMSDIEKIRGPEEESQN